MYGVGGRGQEEFCMVKWSLSCSDAFFTFIAEEMCGETVKRKDGTDINCLR